jgi:integrase
MNTVQNPFQSSNNSPVTHTVEGLTKASQSESTRRSYAQAVSHFKQYGGGIPCDAQTVADYIAVLATTHKVATIQHRLIAIHQTHTAAGYLSPVMTSIVKRTMQGIRRTLGTAQRRVKALVKDDLLETLVLSDQQAPMKAARDKALLLIGFAGAFRRSELVALLVSDLAFNDTGVDILLRRSKTDQEGEGREVFIPNAKGERCPVAALKLWLSATGIESGPVFRSVSRYDKVGCRALTGQSVALLVKQTVGRLHGDLARTLVSGHSLRAGYCTEAAIAGLQTWQIKEQTGHKSDTTLAKYIRPVRRRQIPSLL